MELEPETVEELRRKPSEFVRAVIEETPFDYQKDVLDCNNDRIAFVSGRQVGKSRTAAWIALHHALTREMSMVLITSPTQRQSSELFRQIKFEIRQSDIPSDSWGIDRDTKTEIEFTNLSRIKCLPITENIRGYTTDLVIVDEAADVDDDYYYQVIIPMMATTDGKLVLTGTPKGTSGFLYDAFHGELEEDWFTKQVPSEASPLVGEDFIKIQENQLTTHDFKQEILGKFVSSENSAINEDVIDQCINPDEAKQSDERCYLGVDVARHGDDKSVYIACDGKGNVFLVEYELDNTIPEAVGHINNLDSIYHFNKILIDETQLGSGVVDFVREDLGNKVEGINFGPKSKKNIYTTLIKRMEDSKVNLPDDTNLKKELLDLERSYTPSGRLRYQAAKGGHDDFVDALALCIYALENYQRNYQRSPATF